jgi:hypothetical protein
LENTEENCEELGKIWKKIVKNMENTEENSEMILKIWKKIVKSFGKYRKKVS